MKKNNGKTSTIKSLLKKVGIFPVRITDKKLNRVWQYKGKNYPEIRDIYELPEVREMLKIKNEEITNMNKTKMHSR